MHACNMHPLRSVRVACSHAEEVTAAIKTMHTCTMRSKVLSLNCLPEKLEHTPSLLPGGGLSSEAIPCSIFHVDSEVFAAPTCLVAK
eukprot:scaffold27283_cov18-Tisochrysis_lutea.AAC.1